MGNRTQQTAPGGTTSYTYDANNRLLTAGSTSYSYDANGNLTSISTGQTFAWDVFSRLTSTTASGSTVSYTCNGDGLKTRRVSPNGTTNYYCDGIRPSWETDSTGAMTAQYDRDLFGNLLSRLEPGSIRRYYHFDGLGSTTALTDTTGAVAGTLLYDAWGNVRTYSGTSQGNYRFTGAELDTSTGLYHVGARFYDPTIGRWLSEDPVQDKYFEPETLNFYAYVSNNPVLHTDPTGLEKRGETGTEKGEPKTAAERLQDFINALNDLNQVLEALISRGVTSVHIGRESVSLAGVQKMANELASQAGSFMSLEDFVRNLYEGSSYVGLSGMALVVLAGLLTVAGILAGAPVLGILGMGAFRLGLGAVLIGGGMLFGAWLMDQVLLGGRVRGRGYNQ